MTWAEISISRGGTGLGGNVMNLSMLTLRFGWTSHVSAG